MAPPIAPPPTDGLGNPFHDWGFLEWVLTTVVTAGLAVAGFVWRLALRLAGLDADMRALESKQEENHRENRSRHEELMGELRQTRQTIDSIHRDLTRRVDQFFDRRRDD